MKNRSRRNHCNHLSRSHHSGFSIIELVFAMTFLTIIVLGVVNLQSSNLAMLNGQKNQIQAHFLAIQGTQIVKGLGIGAIRDCKDVDPLKCFQKIQLGGVYSLVNLPEEADPVGETITVGKQDFLRKIQIMSIGAADAYKIRSIVEWEDSTGPHFKNKVDPQTGLPMNSQVETDLIVFN